MIPIIDGDITKSDKDIIVQQVNCKGRMGSGLAETIMKRYGNVRKEYIKYHEKRMKSLPSESDLLGEVNYVDVYDGKIIANIFGQIDIRKGPHDKTVYTKEKALFKGITHVKEKAEELGFSVAIPTYIGCGLAGGDWTSVKEGIDKIFENSSVDVAYYHYRK